MKCHFVTEISQIFSNLTNLSIFVKIIFVRFGYAELKVDFVELKVGNAELKVLLRMEHSISR